MNIPLTKGYTALVDARDYQRVMQYKWHAQVDKKTVYAVRSTYDPATKKTGAQKLHRFILGLTDPKVQVDHKDRDGLNCRRYNMRTTRKQNEQNSSIRVDNKSGYKGVCWYKAHKSWVVQINVEGKRTHIGYFKNIIDAAKAYDEAAIKYFGEFAVLNFPTGG